MLVAFFKYIYWPLADVAARLKARVKAAKLAGADESKTDAGIDWWCAEMRAGNTHR
jgi:hypothetical protein